MPNLWLRNGQWVARLTEIPTDTSVVYLCGANGSVVTALIGKPVTDEFHAVTPIWCTP